MRRVLIVDDEVEIVEFLSNFLKRKEVKVFVATTGHQALGIFKKQKPDIVLLDISMPDIDGLQLLKEMRSETEDIKVIMVTGKDDKDTVAKANKLGANDYIVKPLELDNLYSVVSKYLK